MEKNYQQVEDIFKNSFQNYVLNSAINKYDISFNNQILFLDKISSGFLPSYDHKQTYPNFSKTFKLIDHWTIFDVVKTSMSPILSFKAQSERYQARMNEQYKKFVDEFYELQWENDTLNLATFSFNWNFVKLSGLALPKEFSELDGEDLGTAININRKFFNNKLQNFINIIVEFYKFVDMELHYWAWATWSLKENVFAKYWNDLKSFSFNNFTNSNFKNTPIGEKLLDINLLNFQTSGNVLHPATKSYMGKKGRSLNFRDNYMLSFAFGNNDSKQNNIFPFHFHFADLESRIHIPPFKTENLWIISE